MYPIFIFLASKDDNYFHVVRMKRGKAGVEHNDRLSGGLTWDWIAFIVILIG
jgi:hypothetical protein